MSLLASSIGEAGPVVADLGEHLGAGSRAEPWEAGDDPGVRVLVKRLDGGLLQVASGTRDIYDLMGKDAMVFHHSAHSGNPTDAQYIEHARTWFTSMWDTISYEYLARMTTNPPSGQTVEITRTRCVLLDFDGPICDIYAGLPDVTVADRLRKLITGSGVGIPDDIRRTSDPLAVFTYSATISADLAARVEAELTEQELAAVPSARPTAYVQDVVTSCCESGRAVAVVSNNSDRAVRAYLELHSLDDRVDLVVARTKPDPALLKPGSHLVDQAVTELRAQPAELSRNRSGRGLTAATPGALSGPALP